MLPTILGGVAVTHFPSCIAHANRGGVAHFVWKNCSAHSVSTAHDICGGIARFAWKHCGTLSYKTHENVHAREIIVTHFQCNTIRGEMAHHILGNCCSAFSILYRACDSWRSCPLFFVKKVAHILVYNAHDIYGDIAHFVWKLCGALFYNAHDLRLRKKAPSCSEELYGTLYSVMRTMFTHLESAACGVHNPSCFRKTVAMHIRIWSGRNVRGGLTHPFQKSVTRVSCLVMRMLSSWKLPTLFESVVMQNAFCAWYTWESCPRDYEALLQGAPK